VIVIDCTRIRFFVVASEDGGEAGLEFEVLCPWVVVDFGENGVLVLGILGSVG
jgi:hypothetical protein